MKNLLLIFFLCFQLQSYCQRDTLPYDKLEEIIHANKRYRLHNNYLSVGFGFLGSTLRSHEQAVIGIDYNFHIRKTNFQGGVLMSGNEFLSNNSVQLHLCYGIRKETEKYNFGAYIGPSFNTGVIAPIVTATDTIPPRLFDAYGIYLNAHIFKKISYDIGFGLEAILEVNTVQTFGGLKAVLFFSGAYRGKSKIYNQHVNPLRK